MPSILSAKQAAFDAAVKSWRTGYYTGIADLDALRATNEALGPWVDQLIVIRDSFNGALALEGQHIVGDAPHAPIYLDYLEARTSGARAFADPNHSFIGLTVPLVKDAGKLAIMLSGSDAVVAAINLPHGTDREALKGVLLWMLLGFVISHEYAHHTHGHLALVEASRGSGDQIKRQSYEADADGWAAYLMLSQWVLSDGRSAGVKLLGLESATPTAQDVALSSCFVVAQAAFTFLYAPIPLDKLPAIQQHHPLQPLRLNLMSRYVIKFSKKFRAGVLEVLTQSWYQTLMDVVMRLMWTNGQHALLWRQHDEFLRTPDGVVYRDSVVAALDDFRANTLGKWKPIPGTSPS